MNFNPAKKLSIMTGTLPIMEEFDKEIKELFLIQKQYYDLTRSIFLTSDQISPQNIYQCSNIKTINTIIPGIKSLTDFVFSQVKSNLLIDFLTFSILPSYFKFFLTEQSISRLIDFFLLIRNDPSYTDEQYDLLARVVFISPNFHHFMAMSYQPLFSTFIKSNNQNGINDDNISKLDNIQQNINFFSKLTTFQYLLPKETFAVLKLSTNMQRTLKSSLFKCAFSSEKTTYLYNIFHFSQKPSSQLLSILQSKTDVFVDLLISKSIQNNDFIDNLDNQISTILQNFDIRNLNDLISRVNDTTLYNFTQQPINNIINHYIDIEIYNKKGYTIPETISKSPFSPPDTFQATDFKFWLEYFNPLFISSDDLNLIDFFNGKSTSFNPISDKSCISFYFDFNGTLNNYENARIPIDENIKELLTKCSPLSLIKANPNIDSMHQFLQIALSNIDNNSMFGPSKLEHINKMLTIPENSLVATVNSSFQSIENFQFKFDNSYPNIKPLLLYYNAITSAEISNIEINIKEFNAIDIKKSSLKKYVKDPNLFENEFNDFQYQKGNHGISEFILLKQFICTIDLTMTTFSETRISIENSIFSFKNKKLTLDNYDQNVSQFLSQPNNLFNMINDLFQQDGLLKFFDDFLSTFQFDFFNTGQVGLPGNHESDIISLMLIDCFNENSFIRKNEIFLDLFSFLRMFFNSSDPKHDFDKDRIIMTIAAIILKINPPKLITNFALINDFDINIFSPFRNALNVCIDYLNTNAPNLIDKNLIFYKKDDD